MSNEGDVAREPVLVLQRSNVPGTRKRPALRAFVERRVTAAR
jgi:hypothetical protein